MKRAMKPVEMRCPKCGKLLAEVQLDKGVVERICPGCGSKISLTVTPKTPSRSQSNNDDNVSSSTGPHQDNISGLHQK